jgi:RNA polymerase sigma-70 factor, ECF subfamily
MTATPPQGGREDILLLLPHLRGFARALTGGNEHAADDLVQDTLVLALQAWDRFTPGTNLKAWLFRILHNRHLTVRDRKHHRAELGVDDLSLFGSVPAFQEGRTELRHFKAAFARLNPSHREVLVLYAVHGLPYEAIAAVTGCNAGTVKSRMNRARVALKAMLLGDGREDAPPAGRRDRPREQGSTAAVGASAAWRGEENHGRC